MNNSQQRGTGPLKPGAQVRSTGWESSGGRLDDAVVDAVAVAGGADVHVEHASLASYVGSVVDDIAVSAPLPGLVAQMEMSVRSTSRGKGLRPQQVQEAIQRATWEIVFQFSLFLNHNVQFLRERRALW